MNFDGDPNVKIPWVREDLCGKQTLVMEWIDGIRCTDIDTIVREVDVKQFIRVGVVSGMRQLLEVCLKTYLAIISWHEGATACITNASESFDGPMSIRQTAVLT